jgi:catechol 2,3-dioxygenase-like lactoylglutathione lyase family enzyme
MLIRIWVERMEPLAGAAATEGSEPLPFDGWLELLRVVSELVATAPSRGEDKEGTMRIGLTSMYVNDQDQAEQFYTDVLGFQVKTSAPYGPDERWLSVVSPEEPDGVELVLHLANEPARAFQQASRAAGRPVLSLRTDDCQRDADRLKARGVVFVKEPDRRDYGGIDAVFDDTCGNLINLHQD